MTLQDTPAAGPLDRFGRYALVGGEKALRIPVGIFVSGLTSRALGVEDFGLLSSVLVLLTVMSPLASFGLESLGIALASGSHGAAGYIKSIAPFRLVTGIVAAVLFLLASTAFFHAAADRVAAYALCALATVLVLRIYEIGENLLFAQERLATLAAIRIGALLSANLLIVAVLLVKPGLSQLLAISAAEAALLLAAYAYLFRSDIREAMHQRGEHCELRSAFAQCRAAAPVFLSGLLVLVLLNADKLLVYRFMGKTEVGLYNSAAKLLDVLYFIPMVIGTAHAASFARLAQGGNLLPAYRSALSTATVLSVAAAAVLALCSGFIMPLVFGSPFADASRVLALLAPCLVAVSWVSLRTRALAAMDQRREILRLTLTACAVHFPFLALGLWIGSIEAVALCQSASWMVGAAIVPMFSPVAGRLSPLRALRVAR